MPASSRRLAVLIDADNTSAAHAGAMLEELARYGVPTVKRAYGDWTTQQLTPWKEELHRHAIQPVQQFSYTTGKNSTDSALIIDAMDLLYSGNLDGFAIVSSDSDFTRLATRLRESGKTVIGLGRRRTPASLVAACDRFIYLEVLGSKEAPPATPAAEPDDEAATPLPDLRRILVAAIESVSQDDGWAALSGVGSHIGANNPSFDSRNYGYPKLVELVRAQDYVDVEQLPEKPVRVRLRPSKAVTKTTSRRRTAKKATSKSETTKATAPRG
ncbi:NYN domain-containing protein [Nocardioides sp. MAHUQ-72]|uniref:NYN domain-containing protein n=1 Tax=unclassified Nocardioides TaxID=2615069 RepID=UPI00361BAB03